MDRFKAELVGNQPENLPPSTPEREARKRELRRQWAKQRQAQLQTYTLIPSRPSAHIVAGFSVRDPEDIRPDRPISHKEIDEVNARFWQLPYLSTGKQLEEALEIGFRLRCWHDLFAAEALWIKWRDVHITIPAESVSRCMLLWDYNEQLRNALARRRQK